MKRAAFAKGYRVTPMRETVFRPLKKVVSVLEVIKRGRPPVIWVKGVVPYEIVLNAKCGAVKQGHCRSLLETSASALKPRSTCACAPNANPAPA